MIKIIAFIISVISSLLAMLGFGQTPKYDPAAYHNALPASVTQGSVRVQLLSDTLVRIETEGPKGFENRPSFTVEKRTGWENVPYTTEITDGCLKIKTRYYTVSLPENAERADQAYITDPAGRELWRYAGESDASVFLPEPSGALDSWAFCDAPRVIPSENGYAVSASAQAYNGWDLGNGAQDLFVFLPRGDYKTFTRDFVELTGRSEMLPLQMLGFWDSRYYEYTEETALRQIMDYRERGYPIDMLVIDTDWRNATSGAGYDINLKDFPNMSRFLSKAHEMNVGVIFNDHPEPTQNTDNLLDASEVFFRNYQLKKLLGKGLDYWWYDRNWWTSLKPIDGDLSIYTSGMYAYYQITKDYYEAAAKDGGYARRPAIMANVDGVNNGNLEYASELAAHRYSLQWTGDIGTTGASLQKEIYNLVYGGVGMGLPYMSSDLGGHTSEVSKDMYVRWIQYGALSPIMRVHCTKPYSRMPWLYGELAEKVTHTYVDMRYRLLPLFYDLSHQNYETGLPLVRRLDIEYPQYEEAARKDEYLLGDSVLVAPIAESCAQAEDCFFTCGGERGLRAEYYTNTELTGEPEIVRYEASPYHDWVFDAPDGLSVSDYFSVRWTGELHVGEKPVFIRVMSDDGIRIWLDGELIVDGWDVWDVSFDTGYIPANSVHDIKLEYFDGNNHAHIFFSLLAEGEVKRDVFIPDGDWIDVWSGEAYTGPVTAEVSHSLETSPIFVKRGSVTVLADNMPSTKDGDWSHLTLDVYPDAAADTHAEIYEDDCETVAYKSGQFRTAEIRLKGEGAVQTLTVCSAVGGFTGERAFTERAYTVRVHAPENGIMKSVTVNGKPVPFSIIAQDRNAAPFAVGGGARDGAVYEFSFGAGVYENTEIVFAFE